jgi:hypothetical protein
MAAIRSKLSRAICAYLISKGCGSSDDVFPNFTTKTRPITNTTVTSKLAKVDPDQRFTGNRRIQVYITVKGSASADPEQADAETQRIQFEKRVADTHGALMQTDDYETLKFTAAAITTAGRSMAIDASNGAGPDQVQFAADNADMVNFTCQDWFEGVEGDGPDADAEGNAWEEVFMFEAIACPSALG